jgi:hypothetical protein
MPKNAGFFNYPPSPSYGATSPPSSSFGATCPLRSISAPLVIEANFSPVATRFDLPLTKTGAIFRGLKLSPKLVK